MEIFEKMKELLTTMEEDASKFYLKGNALAGRRTRKYLQDMKKLAQSMREEIQDLKTK